MAQKADEVGTLYFSRQFFIRVPPVEVEDSTTGFMGFMFS